MDNLYISAKFAKVALVDSRKVSWSTELQDQATWYHPVSHKKQLSRRKTFCALKVQWRNPFLLVIALAQV